VDLTAKARFADPDADLERGEWVQPSAHSRAGTEANEFFSLCKQGVFESLFTPAATKTGVCYSPARKR
jgi:hypothetical protein